MELEPEAADKNKVWWEIPIFKQNILNARFTYSLRFMYEFPQIYVLMGYVEYGWKCAMSSHNPIQKIFYRCC